MRIDPFTYPTKHFPRRFVKVKAKMLLQQLCKLYNDFSHSFTIVIRNELHINIYLKNLPPHLNRVVIVPEKISNAKIISNAPTFHAQFNDFW